ncbi:MAG: hypothetical protein H6919_01805 [Sphingomonadaceae bacterium]|nr:hypothetical protein [Sphingomonadaceae bacterium]MCP5392635.1 hypothetical protein [Sphingomonadaceae bacterium]
MDTLRGNFGLPDDSNDERDWDSGEDEIDRELPPASIGTDERRMQVRAYNHWAGLLGDRSFPSIEDLEPETLTDFGPFSVLLDFSTGIEDPAIQFLGEQLAEECGTDVRIAQLSDVPSRSLLSRITDHYLQILANQAPIGFEAEFVNQREATILYRGILLPYSSDGETIDFIYGVINWKEMADQATSDELLLEIDQALDAGGEDEDVLDLEAELDDTAPPAEDMSDATDWADGPGSAIADLPDADPAENASSDDDWPMPEFGLDGDEPEEEIDEDYDPVAIFGEEANRYAVDYGNRTEEDEEYEEDEAVVSRLSSLIGPRGAGGPALGYDEDEEDDCEDEDDFGEQPMFAPRSPLLTKKTALPPIDYDRAGPQVSYDDLPEVANGAAGDDWADEPFELGNEFVEETDGGETPESTVEAPDEAFAEADQADFDAPAGPDADEISDASESMDFDPEAGLYDCLAEARELAQAARSSEDRSRSALYAAVGRAYDVCLAAENDPEEFAELVAESGLTVQDRAPMTPVVKLVFGVDYDKSRLAEYASVLAHARRLDVARGELAGFLSQAEGGLKGVVQAERQLRKEEAGKPVAPRDAVRPALAKKLRKLDTLPLDEIDPEGDEFGVVLIRRMEDGSVVMLGEVSDDIALVEKVARKLA